MIDGMKLRHATDDDLVRVLEWRNSQKVRLTMYNDQIISVDQHVIWFERMLKDDAIVFLICEYEGAPVGLVNFTNLDHKNSRCDWGFYLGADSLPRGAGTSMCRLGLQYAFTNLQMRKVCGEAFAFNTASIRVHEKLGFIQEGRFREHIYKNGVYEDVIRFGLLKDDFLEGENGHA